MRILCGAVHGFRSYSSGSPSGWVVVGSGVVVGAGVVGAGVVLQSSLGLFVSHTVVVGSGVVIGGCVVCLGGSLGSSVVVGTSEVCACAGSNTVLITGFTHALGNTTPAALVPMSSFLIASRFFTV